MTNSKQPNPVPPQMNENPQSPQFDGKPFLITITLCVLFYLGYSQYLNNKYPKKTNATEATEQLDQNNPVASSPPTQASEPATLRSAENADNAKTQDNPSSHTTHFLEQEELRISNPDVTYQFFQDQAAINSATLTDYRAEFNPEKKQDAKGETSNRMDLIDYQLSIQGFPYLLPNYHMRPLDVLHGYDAFRLDSNGSEEKKLSFSRKVGAWKVEQIYTIPPRGYDFRLQIRYTNESSQPQDLNASLLLQKTLDLSKIKDKKGSSFLPLPYEKTSVIIGTTSDTERSDLNKFCTEADAEPIFSSNSSLAYIGFDQHYFLNGLLPDTQNYTYSVERALAPIGFCSVAIKLTQPQGMIAPNESASLNFTGYFGPKHVATLEKTSPVLKGSLDLGFFGFLAHPLLACLKFLESFLMNWGLAIIVMTFLLKLLFFPLTKKASASMYKMKKLQPEMTKIREKHKGDPQNQQKELMRFMAQHKVNPMQGCLPILPQIPVFFAFYQVLSASIELRHAPFYGWILDLSAKDPYYITPILLGVCFFVQQKLTPTTGMDKTQEKIMMFLPLVFTVMMLTLPAGMVLYMLTNTIVSITQTQWLNKRLEAQGK